jgi:hypothetical protein
MGLPCRSLRKPDAVGEVGGIYQASAGCKSQIQPHVIKGAVALWAEPVLWSTRRGRGTPRMASWRSGYAEDCKSLHPGSIPGEASIQLS